MMYFVDFVSGLYLKVNIAGKVVPDYVMRKQFNRGGGTPLRYLAFSDK